nr:ATP-binding protein [Bosea sp. UNC402CLCol]
MTPCPTCASCSLGLDRDCRSQFQSGCTNRAQRAQELIISGGSSLSISTIAINAITWQDILGLIGTSETADIEFKRDLSVPNGAGPHRWHKGEDLDRPGRDGIAREIVALANAWGGTLVLGADEDKSTPRVCCGITKLPRVTELAQKLQAAVQSVIDPPLASLECHAVLDPESDDTGVVVIRVNRSTLAPHGYGDPPASYIRRALAAAPMTMQDLQNVFWDARTRSERIAEERSRASAFLRDSADRGALHGRCRMSWPNPPRGIFFRFCVYPQSSLELQDLDSRNAWTQLLRPEGRMLFEKQPVFPAGDGRISWHPRPIAHGVEVVDQSPSRWLIRDNGSIEVYGFREAVASRAEPEVHYVNPAWLVAPAAQALAMAEAVRRRASRPGVPFEIDAEVMGFHALAHSRINDWEEERCELDGQPASIGPFVYGREESFTAVFRSIEREVWHALGLAHVQPRSIKPGDAVTELLRLWAGA